MPQFEQFDTFVSQMFWLVVVFAIFYVLSSRILIPRIQRQIEVRTDQISRDLIAADSAKQAAQACELRAETIRKEAQEQVAQRLAEQHAKLEARRNEQSAVLQKEFAERRAEHSSNLQTQFDALMEKSDQEAQALSKLIFKRIASET